MCVCARACDVERRERERPQKGGSLAPCDNRVLNACCVGPLFRAGKFGSSPDWDPPAGNGTDQGRSRCCCSPPWLSHADLSRCRRSLPTPERDTRRPLIRYDRPSPIGRWPSVTSHDYLTASILTGPHSSTRSSQPFAFDGLSVSLNFSRRRPHSPSQTSQEYFFLMSNLLFFLAVRFQFSKPGQ